LFGEPAICMGNLRKNSSKTEDEEDPAMEGEDDIDLV